MIYKLCVTCIHTLNLGFLPPIIKEMCQRSKSKWPQNSTGHSGNPTCIHTLNVISTSKRYKICALDTGVRGQGQNHSNPETVCYALWSKVYLHTKWDSCLKLYSSYAPDTVKVQTDRRTDCQLCVQLTWCSSPLVAAKKCRTVGCKC